MSNGSESAWGGGRRRVSTNPPFSSHLESDTELKDAPLSEAKDEDAISDLKHNKGNAFEGQDSPLSSSAPSVEAAFNHEVEINGLKDGLQHLSINSEVGRSHKVPPQNALAASNGLQQDEASLAGIKWSYVDPSGNVQGNAAHLRMR